MKIHEYQAKELLASLPANASYGTIWLDIEHNPSTTHGHIRQNCSWAVHDASSNCEYVRALAGTIAAHNVSVGIYTSHHSWPPIAGASCTALHELPLWYPHCTRRPAPPNAPTRRPRISSLALPQSLTPPPDGTRPPAVRCEPETAGTP